jgi:3'-phosphoadenosine 5'-phosphosulfate sulfotransferase (PAPS reductase)/FAD synthetase
MADLYLNIPYNVSEEVRKKFYDIRPRSIVYLFSGGKDSSLALLLTRDFVKKFSDEMGCKVYMLHIVIAGNSHPLNTYASAYVMEWHKINYGFNPIYRVSNFVFQEGVIRWGLQIGPGRWCFVMHKNRVLRDLEKQLPRPQIHIDGMSPSDSKVRSEKITSEIEFIETTERTSYLAWHPLYSVDLSSEEKFKILEQHEEFKPIVLLYKRFGDSLNCILCPYKGKKKYMKHHAIEGLDIIASFIDLVMRSGEWKKKFNILKNSKKITDYVGY